jgi:hypothetical protein
MWEARRRPGKDNTGITVSPVRSGPLEDAAPRLLRLNPMPEAKHSDESHVPATLWCPTCARPVDDPLTCGDCSAVICRVCGTPLESADELAFG